MPAIPRCRNFTETFFRREAGLRTAIMSRHVFGPDHYVYEREFHRHILPAMSIQSIEGPDGHIHRFTPDGKSLIVFCSDQYSISVLQYRGVGDAQEMLMDLDKEYLAPTDFTFRNLHIRREIFDRIFRLRHLVPVIGEGYWHTYLSREFCLFVDKGRFIILAAMAPTTVGVQCSDYVEYTDLWDEIRICEHSFYLVDILNGSVVDTLRYYDEAITLPHQQGVGFHERTLAIFQIYRQAIEIIRITEDNKFHKVMKIAAFGCPEDRSLFLRTHRFMPPPDSNTSLPLSFLKQKILSHMFRKVISIESTPVRFKELTTYYRNFPQIEKMLISKIQLIDNDHIFIRYEPRPFYGPIEQPYIQIDYSASILFNLSEEERQATTTTTKIFPLYVLYNFTSQEVIRIFDRYSVDLYEVMRNHCDQLRDTNNYYTKFYCSSPSNNIYYRAAFDIGMKRVPGGIKEGVAYFNNMMPFSPQNFSCSPYLDYSLFSYDDRFIANLNRPKINIGDTVLIYDRKSMHPQYRLHLEKNVYDRILYGPPCDNSNKVREMVVFIFHPFEPLILSIQKMPTRYVLNIHIYNPYTVVRKTYLSLSLNN